MTANPRLRTPLELPEFERLLAAGHGRAALDLRIHGLRDRAEALRAACVRNLAYDPQCEVDRGPWILGLLDSVGGSGPLMDDIERVLSTTENDHDAQQMAEILDVLAQRGDERARNVLTRERRRARFRDPDDDRDWTLGPWPPPHDADSFVGPPESDDAPPVPSVEEVEGWLDVVLSAPRPSDVLDLFPRRLFLLDQIPFVARAVELVDHPKPWVRAKVGRLVEQMRHRSLRDEGFRRLREYGFREHAATFLMNNLEEGDTARLESFLPATHDVDAVHDACFDLVALARRHPGEKAWRRLLEWVYERSPCQNCRADAVRRLDDLGVEPWLREEWRLDSDSDTRALGSPAKESVGS